MNGFQIFHAQLKSLLKGNLAYFNMLFPEWFEKQQNYLNGLENNKKSERNRGETLHLKCERLTYLHF